MGADCNGCVTHHGFINLDRSRFFQDCIASIFAYEINTIKKKHSSSYQEAVNRTRLREFHYSDCKFCPIYYRRKIHLTNRILLIDFGISRSKLVKQGLNGNGGIPCRTCALLYEISILDTELNLLAIYLNFFSFFHFSAFQIIHKSLLLNR